MLCTQSSTSCAGFKIPRACAQHLAFPVSHHHTALQQRAAGGCQIQNECRPCRGMALACSTFGTALAARELLNSAPTSIALAARDVSFKWSFGGNDDRIATTLSAESFASPEVLLRDLSEACNIKALLPPAQLTQLHESSMPLLPQMCLAQLGTMLSHIAHLSGTETTTNAPAADTTSNSSSSSTFDQMDAEATHINHTDAVYETWVTAILSSVQSQLNPQAMASLQSSSPHSSSSSSSGGGSGSSSRTPPTASAITKLVWGLSETRIDPGGPLLADLWAKLEPQLSDLYGPDFATLTCALGVIVVETGRPLQPPSISTPSTLSSSSSPSVSSSSPAEQQQQQQSSWVQVLGREAEYQLKQFPNDFDAFSLARLVSGLAGLGFDPDGGFRTILMRAVYPSMKTIEEKAAVDFALAKFGKRSMKYDPRWTFAEMHWLPGHERDKRRIMKENWVKTQWGGY